jgi:hypothetical protein
VSVLFRIHQGFNVAATSAHSSTPYTIRLPPMLATVADHSLEYPVPRLWLWFDHKFSP